MASRLDKCEGRDRSGRWFGALVAVLGIMIVLIAVLALVIVNALAQSPWGTVTIGLTIPIATVHGGYLKWARPGRVLKQPRLVSRCCLSRSTPANGSPEVRNALR